ncbi:hypothetical protein P4O66_020832 [Electrophorus voltai]|uniref:Heparan sulfate proteoglycan 2 n=1 Tax=Electrophorus voltai TaxID=2609070 RepID=A0AAD9E3T4_9TELE|nr:hypothetical protein P4O66_020832 [Electrophorus voltai]
MEWFLPIVTSVFSVLCHVLFRKSLTHHHHLYPRGTVWSHVARSSKVWGEVPFLGDLEAAKEMRPQRYLDDDEDFAGEEASGGALRRVHGSVLTYFVGITYLSPAVYYRALVNFTDSFLYSPELDDIYSDAFQEISSAVVDTLESEYNRIPGTQSVNVVLIKKSGKDVFVELDVGSDDNPNQAQIREVLYSVVSEGTIASYVTSVQGFQFRHLGERAQGLPPPARMLGFVASAAESHVRPSPRPCTHEEFTCKSGTCIPLEYVCDKRPDCEDLSDETSCEAPTPPPAPQSTRRPTTTMRRPPLGLGPCRADQATCQSGECISRDYLCDGERDCSDGSDELKCGTPSPCEPNEFKCQNGRCALKLWRCDGDNDCQDNSDEMDCPARKPGDVCAPEQFVCLSDHTCIPASYQCDEEPDCADRSDEYGCAPPTVTSPPEESITAARGQTVTFTCAAIGVPTPIITWRLNWGHIPSSNRISMATENGRGTLTIRDVKEGDQGAYTCEAINAKGLVFAIPDGVLTLSRVPSDCPEGRFNAGSRCMPCFCLGITKNCQSTGRYRNQIALRFTEEDDFRGVNVSFPTRPGTPPPLSSTQMLVDPEQEEFQLVDLSRRFLDLDSYWTLPRQFLGSKVDSYGGYLRYKVSYFLQRGGSEPLDKPDVVLSGNGVRLTYHHSSPTAANIKNPREIRFTEENWQHLSGQPAQREDLLMVLANLESISLRTIYDNRMVSVGLSDIAMDTTTLEFSLQGQPKDVEECRCPPGYSGLSCEKCSSGFERVPGGPYLGTCTGCNCHGHASTCDPVSGHCLSCQHNTEGPRCDKCRPGYFGDPSRGRPDDCKPCPCPYTETSRRFSDTCFLDVDGQATCDTCRAGYTGRRCEKCVPGYVGNPLQPNGRCAPAEVSSCDNRGTISSASRPCSCKANVGGALCDECKPGSFHLTAGNPDGCLSCFCMGVTQQCASSTWTRDQVRGGVNGQLFSLSTGTSTHTVTEGITQRGSAEVVYQSFTNIPSDIYYWVLPESFRGDKVTAYAGELRYRVRYEPHAHSSVSEGHPDVLLQGNGIFLEHYSQTKPLPRVPTSVMVPFRESAWRRPGGQPCNREHLLMVLADITGFMIRATYASSMTESSISDIQMDIAMPHSTGSERALEVEECACPPGYRGPSCQECDVGYTRTGSGLYLGTCVKCECHGHASSCYPETGACQQCLHNTAGPQCETCLPGFYGDPVTGDAHACRPCPCMGDAPGNNGAKSCYLDTDGHPTCNNCPPGYIGRHCERNETTDDCGEFHLEERLDGYLPVECSPVVYVGTEKRQVLDGSGQGSQLGEKEDLRLSPMATALSKVPTRSLLAVASSIPLIQQSTPPAHAVIVNASVGTRRPVPHTHSPETPQRGSQVLLGVHLNHFNQRLSVLEGSMMDLKEDLRELENRQSRFSLRLEEETGMGSPTERRDRIKELAKTYMDMESRLESLIDGFTALAQKLYKIKRARQVAHPLLRSGTSEISVKVLTTTKASNRASVSATAQRTAVPERNCYHCDQGGSDGCSPGRICRCKMNVEGPSCDTCKLGTFHLSPANKDGCLGCFCMGVTQQCSSSSFYRDVRAQPHAFPPPPSRHQISTMFVPGGTQGFALVNRQRSNRIDSGFSVEVSTGGTQLSHTGFDQIGQEPHYWQLPKMYQGDKVTVGPVSFPLPTSYQPSPSEVLKLDNEIWALLGNFSQAWPASYSTSSPSRFTSSSLSFGATGSPGLSALRAPSPPSSPSALTNPVRASGPPGTSHQTLVKVLYDKLRKNTVRLSSAARPDSSNKVYALVYKGFSLHPEEVLFWQLPDSFGGDKVGSYGGKLKYSVSYVPGSRGAPIEDVDVQIIGNDITLVARQDWRRGHGTRESRDFEIVFREEYWQRPDGMPATREHLMMVLADLDDILIRASYHTEMRSSSISGISMEIAVPSYTGLAQALEVEKCHCPAGYQGLSCQDCAPGYTRTGGGLYLGHCEPCECNGHSDSCHAETGICSSCLHNTMGEQCEQCAPGFFGDATAGTPEDCQPCACPHTDLENQFSPTCESLGNGDYQCTACQPGYSGKYCERCAPGYVGNPQKRIRCQPYNAAASLVVKVHPERVLVSPGSPVTLRCQASGVTPHFFYWTRDDGQPISSSAERHRQGEELHFLSVQASDAAIYTCTCRNQQHTNRSQAEIIITTSPSKPIEVFIEEPKAQTVTIGATVSFICTAKSKLPAYTLVWTRRGDGKLPNRAMDFNGILTIQKVQPEDAGVYVCTGSNMLAMDEGTAVLYVPAAQGAQPVATVQPPVLTVQQGQRAEFHCTATGNPAPAVEWTGGPGNRISGSAVIRGGILTFPTVDRADEGQYMCRALNTHGEHTAQAVLYVHSASFPHVQVSPQQVEIHEGDTLRLYCRAGGTPSPELTWKRRGSRLPTQARTERTDFGTLLIPNVTLADAGTYLCVGTNAIGSSEAPIRVTVIKGETAASVITIQPSIASVVEGEMLDLNCIVPGDPPPSVTWSRASGHLSSFHQACPHLIHPVHSLLWPIVLGTQLRILRASPDDSGEYICRVVGGPHVRQASVSVSVTSESSRLQSPIISIEPHSAAVRQGEAASFRCRVHSGAQPVRLEWKFASDQPLPDNVKIGPDASVITIANAQAKNQGTYRCVASNLFGITHSIVSLVVRESPRATVTPAGPVHVTVGNPINLECQAAGEPRPSVTWHRLDNARKTVLTSPVPAESNVVLQILVARPEDSGTYVCAAQNSQGKTETRVEVVVEGGAQVPTVPLANVKEPLMIVVEGATTTLQCDAHGFPKPTITWSKLRAPLPWRHKIVNNSLVLPSVGRQDSGQYICNATNPLGTSEATIMLDVETPPYTTVLPDDVAVREGEVIRLQCLAHGTPPLRFEWSREGGPLPPAAEQQGADLQINLATPADAGTYVCVASNEVGSSKATAKVRVRCEYPGPTHHGVGLAVRYHGDQPELRVKGGVCVRTHSGRLCVLCTAPLSVRVAPQVEVKAVGSAVEFTCSASGGAEVTLEWLKEGGALPLNHHIKDGVLRIENLEKSNEGVYICRASSVFGQAQDSAKLAIQALPKVTINVRTSVQTVMVGGAVEFECHAVGEPEPSVHWSKAGGPLPEHVHVRGGLLRIEHVTEADAGQYRCTATNDVGSVQSQVVLNVQSLPQIVAQPEAKEVTIGSTAIFPCIASGYPVPTIMWSKLDGELPLKVTQDGHVLTVPEVSHEDSGTYVCTAANKQGKVQAFTKLVVHEQVMPYFSQEPLSYLTMPTIKNSYKAFNIKVTFRPDNVDGMILYNGQKKTMGADFISFGLVGGRPEFRFDVGSGMATIRHPSAIKLGEFHTVQLWRNGTLGSLAVDEEAPINGSSQGKFQGLDLNEELFVGGYPNYSMIAKTAELKTGFVGCISHLVIQGEEIIFKDLDKSSTGVTNCPTCKDHPCQNGGVCQDSVASLYKCNCMQGFTGSNCQHQSALRCHPGGKPSPTATRNEACGPDATCINRPNGMGYDCRCHLGKHGTKCMAGTLVTTPSFDGEDSYITYPPLTNIHNDLRIDMEFKPMSTDGLMFFSGGRKMKVEDFVALSMVDGHVEFRFELGTGQAVLRSQEPVSLGQWHHVSAERLGKDGSLKVDHAREIQRSSPGKAQGLNIYTPMFLGGVPSMDLLPKPANVSLLFDGCIEEVSINGKKLDLSYSFVESQSITECAEQSLCDRRSCQHGGTCLMTAEYEFQCLCRDGYEGERCELVKDACQDSSQCQNGGNCVAGVCVCPVGYTGLFCEEDFPVRYAAYFHDDSYLALPKPMFTRSSPDSPETIQLEINTASPNGLILWQGVEPGEQGRGKDFISLGLQNGHLVFSYQLGSGEAEILSRERIDDQRWHKIVAVRTGKQGYIQVDGRTLRLGQSQGKSIMVNTKGNMYIGGAPDISMLTGGKFTSGLTGCLKNLSLLNARPGEKPAAPIDLQVHAEEGVNVQRCLL